jgi:signal transduction histidine kinase
MTMIAAPPRCSSVTKGSSTRYSFESTCALSDRSNTRVPTCQNAETAEAAHDFRNILGIVSMLSELAQTDLPVSSRANEMLRNIRAACEDANDLCNRMMDDYHHTPKPAERVNLSTLVMAMSPLLATSVPPESALRFELADCTPPVNVSPGAIRQVLMNLVKNSAEAMIDWPGTITIATGVVEFDSAKEVQPVSGKSAKSKRYSYLSVSDTGCGMDDATKSIIFERPVTTKKDGHGLGMASVERIVARYDGLIQVYSQVGRGTQIRVLFPCAAIGPVTRGVE